MIVSRIHPVFLALGLFTITLACIDDRIASAVDCASEDASEWGPTIPQGCSVEEFVAEMVTFSCVGSDYDCEVRATIRADIPAYCCLWVAGWCDSAYACWGTPEDYGSNCEAGDGKYVYLHITTCNCNNETGEIRAWYEGWYCECATQTYPCDNDIWGAQFSCDEYCD